MTSIVLFGDGAMSIQCNYECPTQIVTSQNEPTSIFRSFTPKQGISLMMPGYSNNKSDHMGIKEVKIGEEKLYNIKKLEFIAQLQDNWNNNGAKAFSSDLITKARNFIVLLDIQPEIFPTACDSLQLEYDKQDGSHLEIEVSENEKAEVFIVSKDGDESIVEIKTSFEAINKVVTEFYGSDI